MIIHQILKLIPASYQQLHRLVTIKLTMTTELQIQQQKMSEFEQYLFSQNSEKLQSHQPLRYIVIDSDEQHQQDVVVSLANSQGKILSAVDTNLPSSVVRKNTHAYCHSDGSSQAIGNERKGSGIINKHIRDKKEEKCKIDKLKMQINKIESQCQALEQLIERVIKKQAELEVKKYNLLRQQPKIQYQKQRQIKQISKTKTVEQRSRRGLSQCLDIKRTIKTFNSKPR